MSTDPYPYPVDGDNHEYAWMFFNITNAPRFDLDTANIVCAHLEKLGVDLTPEATHDSEIIYDALGGVGAPWENGIWQEASKPRMEFTTTVPDVDVTAMTEAQRAELKLALDMADIADASSANPHRKDPI
ncbi:hypothetical protein FGG65_gp17 [Corynebacterium phage phi673]|uniref:Uncharacterized protein n=1 Tax=Corynebacterium phage phi673 TaxID=2052821 RepID=A0A2H4PIS7_9CAUD|nr:hypothetical protein FGG65_gp17 [Corynebacterium phage phi673]ATW62879.1 hypothetical protein phi673_gp17 [Corynebacterium phage phi673]